MEEDEDGLLAIAEAVNNLARAIDRLGNGNAATPMGAIENLAKEIKDGFETLASSISELKSD
jgi:hypothetical protein